MFATERYVDLFTDDVVRKHELPEVHRSKTIG
jgi:hypothetical protein